MLTTHTPHHILWFGPLWEVRVCLTPDQAALLKKLKGFRHLCQAEGAATGPGVSATQAQGVQGLGRGLERHRFAQEHEGRRRAPRRRDCLRG